MLLRLFLLALVLSACAGAPAVTDAGGEDSGTPDAGLVGDGGPGDAGVSDAGAQDGGAVQDAGAGDGGATDGGLDQDGDGLPDDFEAALAAGYFPYLSLAPDDACPLGGIVYRVHPHPDDPTLVRLFFAHLYERDCGLNGHVGDNEDFGVTVDPSLPPPQGFKTLKAIGHQGTICQQVTSCGRCGGLTGCEYTDAGLPILYVSKNKHAGYVERSRCNPVTACLDTCAFNPVPRVPPMVNAGEPGRPLVRELTDEGFITVDGGWTEPSVFHFDPWDAGAMFGTVSGLAGRLVDPQFVPPACR
ncbi:MAG: hypothetical protein IT380_00960 [Myxococcales bacterium]|nr:hypothetical protein [Myxococcales bacterium]